MSNLSYEEKLNRLEAPTPVFSTFVTSASLITSALVALQIIL